jgi:hypothetical protein
VRARRLLAREGQRGIGAAARRGDSPGSADGSHLSAASASAEELITAIRLEARHAHSRRHLKALQDLSRARINTPQIALVTFQGAVPELSIIPGDPRDEAVGLDGAKNCPCMGINLMDLPVPILPHPERPIGPGEPRVTAAAGFSFRYTQAEFAMTSRRSRQADQNLAIRYCCGHFSLPD